MPFAQKSRAEDIIVPRSMFLLSRYSCRSIMGAPARLHVAIGPRAEARRARGDPEAHMELTLTTVLIAFAGVFLICFMKGAFGGGFSIVGIPLLSFVMDPVTAGGLLAPLFIAMDLFALRYWKPSTWSKPDLALLLPGLVIGIGFGYLLFRGLGLARYLLRLGLSKGVYAGTTSLFFTVGNATKAVPWLLLVRPSGNIWILMAACLLAIPPVFGLVGGFTEGWTSIRFTAPATD